jgi:hypothetical protein
MSTVRNESRLILSGYNLDDKNLYWAKLFYATPETFIFGFKVPEDITVSTWPKHAR